MDGVPVQVSSVMQTKDVNDQVEGHKSNESLPINKDMLNSESSPQPHRYDATPPKTNRLEKDQNYG